jgi:hypothetical protein
MSRDHTQKSDNFHTQESPTTFQMSTHQMLSTFSLLLHSLLSSIRQA